MYNLIIVIIFINVNLFARCLMGEIFFDLVSPSNIEYEEFAKIVRDAEIPSEWTQIRVLCNWCSNILQCNLRFQELIICNRTFICVCLLMKVEEPSGWTITLLFR